MVNGRGKPMLLVDVDGVVSLFGFDPARPPAGRLELVDGIVHLLSAPAGGYLRTLAGAFELRWCTGWEERANEYLPSALDCPGPLPYLSFAPARPEVTAHWKLSAIDRCATPDRPLAWIDDAHDQSCGQWAARRSGPTLLVTTDPAVGITAEHVATLLDWAETVAGSAAREPR